MMVRMILSFVLLLSLGLLFSTPAMSRRQMQEKARLDSMRVADSLHMVDSIRIADSISLARYELFAKNQEEKKLKEQKELEAQKQMQDSLARIDIALSSESIAPLASREIIIPPGSEEERMVDSLDKEILAVQIELYADRHFKKAKGFSLDKKIDYLRHLLNQSLRTRQDVIALTEKLLLFYNLSRQRLAVIMQTQDANNRSFLMLHASKMAKEVKPLGDFLVFLQPSSEPLIRRRASAVAVEQSPRY